MDEKRRLLEEMEERAKKNLDLQIVAYQRLGEFSAQNLGDLIPPGEAAETAQQINNCQKNIQDNSAQILRIQEIVARLEEIRKTVKNRETEIAGLQKDCLPYFEEYGRWALPREKQFSLTPEGKERFDAVKKLQEQISSMDSRVTSLKDKLRDDAFLSKLLDGGKLLVLNSSQTIRNRSLEKQFQDLGQFLLDAGESPEDLDFLKPLREKRDTIEKIRKTVDDLRAEEESLKGDCSRLGVTRRHQRRIKELETENDKTRDSLQELYQVLGREIHHQIPAGTEKKKDFQALLGDINLLQKREAENARELEKIRLALAQEELDIRLNDLQRQLEAEEEIIRNHRLHIESLKKEIDDTQALRADLGIK